MKSTAMPLMAQPLKIWLCSALLVVISLGTASAEDLRRWTDTSNRHLDASLVEVKDGKVHLKKQDGKVLPVNVIYLSNADREYVKWWQADRVKPSPPQEMEPIALASFSAPKSEDYRLWTDTSNRRVVASLMDVKDGEVHLKKRDGKVLPVGVVHLGAEDQDYVKKWQADLTPPHPSLKTETETIARAIPVQPTDMRPWPDSVSSGTEVEVQTIREDMAGRNFIYRTEHFEFRSDVRLGANVVKDFGRLFESTYTAVKALPLDLKPVPTSGYFVTRLFENKEDYHRAGGPSNSGGLYIPSAKSILVPLDSLGVKRLGSRYTIENREDNQVLIHEITHQVMDRWFGLRMPVWLAEGFADLMASSKYRMGRFAFVRQQDSISSFLKEREVISESDSKAPVVLTPLEHLTRLTYTQWIARLQKENYTTSLLLTSYFCRGDDLGDGANLSAYLRALESGVPEFAARARFLFRGRSAAELQTDVARYWRRQGLDVTFENPVPIVQYRYGANVKQTPKNYRG